LNWNSVCAKLCTFNSKACCSLQLWCSWWWPFLEYQPSYSITSQNRGQWLDLLHWQRIHLIFQFSTQWNWSTRLWRYHCSSLLDFSSNSVSSNCTSILVHTFQNNILLHSSPFSFELTQLQRSDSSKLLGIFREVVEDVEESIFRKFLDQGCIESDLRLEVWLRDSEIQRISFNRWAFCKRRAKSWVYPEFKEQLIKTQESNEYLFANPKRNLHFFNQKNLLLPFARVHIHSS